MGLSFTTAFVLGLVLLGLGLIIAVLFTAMRASAGVGYLVGALFGFLGVLILGETMVTYVVWSMIRLFLGGA